MSTTVFVSGATGFIAQYVIDELLKTEKYKVIGSARSQEKADKLLSQFNNSNLSMEIVPNIAEPDAFDHIFAKYAKDIKVVLHTASPFFFESKDFDKDLLIPAVNGTSSILKAVKKYAANTVERVVITSSYAAVCTFNEDSQKGNVINEESWNTMSWEEAKKDGIAAYCASKAFAERFVWEFFEANKNELKFKLSTINPVFVFGPQLFDESVAAQLNTSCELINKVVHSSLDSEIDQTLFGGYIDVRDVARAHICAFEKDDCIGQRLILAEERFTMQTLADIINQDFPQLRSKIATGKPKSDVQVLSQIATLDNSKSRKLLGFDFIPLKQSVDDTVSQLLKVEGRL